MKLLSPVDGPGSPSLPVTANNHEKQPSTSVLGQDQVLSQPISQTSPDKRHAETVPDDGPLPPTKKIKKSKKSADNDDSDEDVDGPSILLEPQKLKEGEVDVNAEADQLFEKWMEFTPKFGEYLIEGSEPLLSNKTTGRVSFREIASKFDTKKYFLHRWFSGIPLNQIAC